jgi:hypothetical protein
LLWNRRLTIRSMIEVPNARRSITCGQVRMPQLPRRCVAGSGSPQGGIWFIQAGGRLHEPSSGYSKLSNYPAKTPSSNELTQIVPRNLPKVWSKTEARCSKMSQSSLNLNSDAHAVSPG